ncbi:MAG: prepilin peptidase [Parcubacteria group bacterium]|jgi:leader peptidase (prepilin peptidase)/N-methyltransferase
MIFITFFILGLIIGSFLNVVVYRLRVAESIAHGRSKCPNCQKQIVWYDNIPLLSFILLRQRCRYCREKISYQYPLVEVGTGLLFALVGLNFFNMADLTTWTTTLYYLGVISFLVAIFVYDFLYMEIPDLVLWPAVTWVIAFGLILEGGQGGQGGIGLIYSGVLAAFVAFAFFFALVAVSKEKWMGMGDAYLVILLGLILGWPNILLALFLAFGMGAIFGLVLIVLKKKKMQSQIPFAPFLILGTLLALFWYAPIVNWYLGLF